MQLLHALQLGCDSKLDKMADQWLRGKRSFYTTPAASSYKGRRSRSTPTSTPTHQEEPTVAPVASQELTEGSVERDASIECDAARLMALIEGMRG
jgi:hypothetical protein